MTMTSAAPLNAMAAPKQDGTCLAASAPSSPPRAFLQIDRYESPLLESKPRNTEGLPFPKALTLGHQSLKRCIAEVEAAARRPDGSPDAVLQNYLRQLNAPERKSQMAKMMEWRKSYALSTQLILEQGVARYMEASLFKDVRCARRAALYKQIRAGEWTTETSALANHLVVLVGREQRAAHRNEHNDLQELRSLCAERLKSVPQFYNRLVGLVDSGRNRAFTDPLHHILVAQIVRDWQHPRRHGVYACIKQLSQRADTLYRDVMREACAKGAYDLVIELFGQVTPAEKQILTNALDTYSSQRKEAFRALWPLIAAPCDRSLTDMHKAILLGTWLASDDSTKTRQTFLSLARQPVDPAARAWLLAALLWADNSTLIWTLFGCRQRGTLKLPAAMRQELPRVLNLLRCKLLHWVITPQVDHLVLDQKVECYDKWLWLNTPKSTDKADDDHHTDLVHWSLARANRAQVIPVTHAVLPTSDLGVSHHCVLGQKGASGAYGLYTGQSPHSAIAFLQRVGWRPVSMSRDNEGKVHVLARRAPGEHWQQQLCIYAVDDVTSGIQKLRRAGWEIGTCGLLTESGNYLVLVTRSCTAPKTQKGTSNPSLGVAARVSPVPHAPGTSTRAAELVAAAQSDTDASDEEAYPYENPDRLLDGTASTAIAAKDLVVIHVPGHERPFAFHINDITETWMRRASDMAGRASSIAMWAKLSLVNPYDNLTVNADAARQVADHPSGLGWSFAAAARHL